MYVLLSRTDDRFRGMPPDLTTSDDMECSKVLGTAAIAPATHDQHQQECARQGAVCRACLNSRDAERLALAYTAHSVWRDRDRFVTGRAEIVEFFRQKWQRELDYALRKEMWAYTGNQGQAVSRVAETSRPVAVSPVPRAIAEHRGPVHRH
jgi:hypothetical protein